MILAVLMSIAGWAVPWIAAVPVALTLSQLPLAVLVLAWLAEHADRVDDAARAAWARLQAALARRPDVPTEQPVPLARGVEA